MRSIPTQDPQGTLVDLPIALPVGQAARMVGLSRSGIYQLMSEGRLAYVKVGSRRLIRRVDLMAFVDAHLVDRSK